MATRRPAERRAHAVTRSQKVGNRELDAARDRRKLPTPSERLAWGIVRGRRLFGLKFRREQPLDGFCIDLYCARLRVCIEIDGGVHDDPTQADHDAQRARAIERAAIRVLRIPAEHVSRESLEALVRPLLDAAVAETIARAESDRPPNPSPSTAPLRATALESEPPLSTPTQFTTHNGEAEGEGAYAVPRSTRRG